MDMLMTQMMVSPPMGQLALAPSVSAKIRGIATVDPNYC